MEKASKRTYRRIPGDNMLSASLMGTGLRNLVMRLLRRFCYQLHSFMSAICETLGETSD